MTVVSHLLPKYTKHISDTVGQPHVLVVKGETDRYYLVSELMGKVAHQVHIYEGEVSACCLCDIDKLNLDESTKAALLSSKVLHQLYHGDNKEEKAKQFVQTIVDNREVFQQLTQNNSYLG